jgi:flavin-dependent dehydrogenase
MRDKLDFSLVTKAKDKGIIVNSHEKATEIIQEENYTIVKTDKSEYKSKYIVGADGAHSITAKHFNISKKYAIAIEAEILTTSKINFYKNDIGLYYGIIPHGYGWVFPKKDVISIGIGSFLPKVKGLKNYYYKFKKNIGLIDYKEKILRGHPIPILTHKNSKYNNGKILLAGDAAGLADPLSGEGIYYSLQSGIWAAEAIINSDLDEYTEKINSILIPQLKQAEILSKIIYNALPIINKLINSNPEIAKKLVEVIYGKSSYNDLFKYLTKKYSIFRIKDKS